MGNNHSSLHRAMMMQQGTTGHMAESTLIWQQAFSLSASSATLMGNNAKMCVFLGPMYLEAIWGPGFHPQLHNMPFDLEAYINPDGNNTLNLEHYTCPLYQPFKYQLYEKPQDKQGQYFIVLTNPSTNDTIMVRWHTFITSFAPAEFAQQPRMRVENAWQDFNAEIKIASTNYSNYTDSILLQSRSQQPGMPQQQGYGGMQQQGYGGMPPNYGGGVMPQQGYGGGGMFYGGGGGGMYGQSRYQ